MNVNNLVEYLGLSKNNELENALKSLPQREYEKLDFDDIANHYLKGRRTAGIESLEESVEICTNPMIKKTEPCKDYLNKLFEIEIKSGQKEKKLSEVFQLFNYKEFKKREKDHLKEMENIDPVGTVYIYTESKCPKKQIETFLEKNQNPLAAYIGLNHLGKDIDEETLDKATWLSVNYELYDELFEKGIYRNRFDILITALKMNEEVTHEHIDKIALKNWRTLEALIGEKDDMSRYEPVNNPELAYKIVITDQCEYGCDIKRIATKVLNAFLGNKSDQDLNKYADDGGYNTGINKQISGYIARRCGDLTTENLKEITQNLAHTRELMGKIYDSERESLEFIAKIRPEFVLEKDENCSDRFSQVPKATRIAKEAFENKYGLKYEIFKSIVSDKTKLENAS